MLPFESNLISIDTRIKNGSNKTNRIKLITKSKIRFINLIFVIIIAILEKFYFTNITVSYILLSLISSKYFIKLE